MKQHHTTLPGVSETAPLSQTGPHVPIQQTPPQLPTARPLSNFSQNPGDPKTESVRELWRISAKVKEWSRNNTIVTVDRYFQTKQILDQLVKSGDVDLDTVNFLRSQLHRLAISQQCRHESMLWSIYPSTFLEPRQTCYGYVFFREHRTSLQPHVIKISSSQRIHGGEDPRSEALFYTILSKDGHSTFITPISADILPLRVVLITEYLVNGSLESALSKNFAALRPHIKKIFTKLVYAVDYLHNHMNTSHLDLKPDNVLLDADFNPLLVDFGMARATTFSEHRNAEKNDLNNIDFARCHHTSSTIHSLLHFCGNNRGVDLTRADKLIPRLTAQFPLYFNKISCILSTMAGMSTSPHTHSISEYITEVEDLIKACEVIVTHEHLNGLTLKQLYLSSIPQLRLYIKHQAYLAENNPGLVDLQIQEASEAFYTLHNNMSFTTDSTQPAVLFPFGIIGLLDPGGASAQCQPGSLSPTPIGNRHHPSNLNSEYRYNPDIAMHDDPEAEKFNDFGIDNPINDPFFQFHIGLDDHSGVDSLTINHQAIYDQSETSPFDFPEPYGPLSQKPRHFQHNHSRNISTDISTIFGDSEEDIVFSPPPLSQNPSTFDNSTTSTDEFSLSSLNAADSLSGLNALFGDNPFGFPTLCGEDIREEDEFTYSPTTQEYLVLLHYLASSPSSSSAHIIVTPCTSPVLISKLIPDIDRFGICGRNRPIGTFQYQAPENANRSIAPFFSQTKADVYSLGLILLRLMFNVMLYNYPTFDDPPFKILQDQFFARSRSCTNSRGGTDVLYYRGVISSTLASSLPLYHPSLMTLLEDMLCPTFSYRPNIKAVIARLNDLDWTLPDFSNCSLFKSYNNHQQHIEKEEEYIESSDDEESELDLEDDFSDDDDDESIGQYYTTVRKSVR